MNDLTIYHNSRCSKSRKTLQIIKDNGIQPTVVEYLKKPLKKFELENISRLLNKRPKEFVRKNEIDFEKIFNKPFKYEDTVKTSFKNKTLYKIIVKLI